ncbi:MAG: SLC13 family permease [Balneolaceae bacterium]
MSESNELSLHHEDSSSTWVRWVGLLGGAGLFLTLLFLPAPEGLSLAGWRTAAVALLMATWWVTEVVPISVTALLPMILFPVLGIAEIAATTAPYANPMIFLFMGGFVIAIAMQRWNLHRRIALNIIARVGSKPRSIVIGFMISTAFMSMWVSNTAATLMMLPIAISVIELARDPQTGVLPDSYRNFSIGLMLAIAFSSSVGGLGTVIGTPTNALMIAFADEAYGVQIQFSEWMMIGLPVVVLGLPIIYLVLTRWVYPVVVNELPGGKEFIHGELQSLGGITKPEKWVAAVFVMTGTLWLSRPLLIGLLPGLSDAGIAIFGATLLFLIPVDWKNGRFLLTWKEAEKLPWGVLILFGGGLTLAGAIQRTGLAEWVGGYFGILDGLHLIWVLLAICFVIIMFTELASNSATAAAFLPVIGSVALGIGEDPVLMTLPVALVASCAFMLPVATPPNAIVYGSGVLSISQMARAGFVLNIIFTVLISLLTVYLFSFWVGV